MPDADGRFKGFAHSRKSAATWERIFGCPSCGRSGRHGEHSCAVCGGSGQHPAQTVALPDKAQTLLERGFNAGA